MRIITTIIITIISSLTLANNYNTKPAGYTLVIASNLDAIMGCPQQLNDLYIDEGGACYTLNYASIDLHKSMVDLEIMRYHDINPITAWEQTGPAYVRGYEVDDYGIVMFITAPHGEFGSVGGFIDLE